MTQTKNAKGTDFLTRISDSHLDKEQLFTALFDARGVGEDINTRHVFFQEVIIKFNASKAAAVIKNHLPYETDSHYVDVALYKYLQIGGDMKEFDRDLHKYKAEYRKTHMRIPPQLMARAAQARA